MLRAVIAGAARRRISLASARSSHELAQAQARVAGPEGRWLEPSWVPLYATISKLGSGRPPGSVAAELDAWIRQRNPISEDQIVTYVRKLRKFRKDACALELMDWMEAHGAELRLTHHAIRLDLISKVHGIHAAEEYFWSLPDMFKSISERRNSRTISSRSLGHVVSFFQPSDHDRAVQPQPWSHGVELLLEPSSPARRKAAAARLPSSAGLLRLAAIGLEESFRSTCRFSLCLPHRPLAFASLPAAPAFYLPCC